MSQYNKTEISDRPASQMAHRTVKKLLKKLPQRLKQAGSGQSSERVHKLRVACRKASAALKLYGEFMPKKKTHRLEKKLAKILHATGAARDLGVMAKHRKGVPRPLIRGERKKAQRVLEKAVRPLVRKHLESMISGIVSKAGGDASPLPFSIWVRPEIRKLVVTFFAASPAKNAAVKDLHKFRILGKELRYAIEISEKAFDAVRRKKVLQRMASIQEALGKINDLASENKYFTAWMQEPENIPIAPFLRERIAENKLEIAGMKAAFEKQCTPAFLLKFRGEIEKMLGAQ